MSELTDAQLPEPSVVMPVAIFTSPASAFLYRSNVIVRPTFLPPCS